MKLKFHLFRNIFNQILMPAVEYLSKFDRFLHLVSKILINLFIILASIVILIFCLHEFSRRDLIIEEFSVPQELIDRGIDGKYLSLNLIEKIHFIQNNATLSLLNNELKKEFDDFELKSFWFKEYKNEVPDFKLPGTDIFFKPLVRYIKNILGFETKSIKNYILSENNKKISIYTYFDTENSVHIIGNSNNIEILTLEIAKNIFKVEDPLTLSIFLLANGFIDESYDVFNKCLENKSKKDDIWAYILRGTVNNIKGNNENAINDFKQVIKLDHKNASAWFNLGYNYNKIKNFEKSVKCYDKSIKINRDVDITWHNRGNSLLKLNKIDEALSSYNKAISLNPNYANAWFSKGNLFLNNKKSFKDAIVCFNKAIDINPNNDNYWNNLGKAFGELKNHKKAIKCYEKALQLKADKTITYYNLGISLVALGKYDDAINSYSKALELDSSNYKIWHNLASIYYYKANYKRALGFYKRATQIKYDEDISWYMMGVCNFFLNDYKNAIINGQKAIKYNSNNADAYFLLAKCFSEIGNKEKASTMLKKAISIDNKLLIKAKEHKEFLEILK